MHQMPRASRSRTLVSTHLPSVRAPPAKPRGRRRAGESAFSESTARAGNRRFWCLSALRAHTKAPYKMDFHRKTLRALNRPKAARTVPGLTVSLQWPGVGMEIMA